jgi:hypothetical protein
MESVAAMLATLNVMPQLIGQFADLLVEAQDWPMAQQIADRIRLSMDPAMLKPSEITPQIAANAQGKQQAAGAAQQAQQAILTANLQKTQSEAAMNAARAQNYLTESQLAPSHADAQTADTASQIEDRAARTQVEAAKAAAAP